MVFLLPPSAHTAQNQSSTIEIDHYRLTTAGEPTVTGRFQVVMGQKQPQSAVSLGSERSVYQSAGGPVHTPVMGGTRRNCNPC
ncbi:hypothetical protein BHM03_00015405 [Ensete ventricosum]|nr:hypothetical protein BHM03_00015405 [Ensete ventricosum]